MFYSIKAEFGGAAEYLCDSMASFSACELISFEKSTLYLVISSMLTFDTNKLKKEVINEPEVRKCREFLELPESLIYCHY